MYLIEFANDIRGFPNPVRSFIIPATSSFQAAQELDPTKFATADLTLGYDYNAQDPAFNVPFFAVEVGCFLGD